MKTHNPSTVVLKLGGSVLRDHDAYPRCAGWLAARLHRHPQERLVVVVSAPLGATDRLQALAQSCSPQPDQRLLDLLWTTGETHSVALLALCLNHAGIPAAGLAVHQCGLELVPVGADRDELRVNPLPLRAHLRRNRVVVVPGFFARGRGDSVVSLGRGGSDLTAVLLAAGLQARRCELIKDVPGYFTKDPNKHADARPVPHVSFAEALVLAAGDCDLVQARALQAAARTNTDRLVRGLDEHGPYPLVSREVPPGDVPVRLAI